MLGGAFDQHRHRHTREGITLSHHSPHATARILLALCVALALAAGGCAASKKDALADLPSAEELYQEGIDLTEGGVRLWGLDMTDYEKAIDRFQDVVDNYPYSPYAVLAELRIADSYFAQRRWDEALSYYREFSELHPNHEKVPYTIFRSALCHHEQSHDPERDQTATREALTLLGVLIERYPRAPEAAAAEVIWRDLRTRLGRHEMKIGDFYLEQAEHQSAANRYRAVLNEYPGLGLDAEALYKLGVAYTHMNRDDEAQQIFEVILRNYEGSNIAGAAEQLLVPAAN